eukprot:scaffold484350_cov46-Prasinocladus_malaysianus.AAC.1
MASPCRASAAISLYLAEAALATRGRTVISAAHQYHQAGGSACTIRATHQGFHEPRRSMNNLGAQFFAGNPLDRTNPPEPHEVLNSEDTRALLVGSRDVACSNGDA